MDNQLAAGVSVRSGGVAGRSRFLSVVGDHQLVAFFILAYAITWSGYAVAVHSKFINNTVLSTIFSPLWGPAIAASILTVVVGGRRGTREFMASLVRWRVGLRWYAIALFAIPAMIVLATGLSSLTSGSFQDSAFTPHWYSPLLWFLPTVALHFVISGLTEEPGWRGFALPRLLSKHNAVVASLILGILWGLWHLAAYVLLAPFSPMVFGLFLVNTLGVSVCVTWIYVHTRRSTFISTLFHGSIDAAGSLFLFGAGKNAGPIFIIVTALICLAALGIVVTNGPNLSRFRQGGAAC